MEALLAGPDDDARERARLRALRAERASALARRGAAGPGTDADAGVDHLVCVCGAERYGLPLAAVARVLPMRPCTPVPGAVPALVGLVALSGRIVGVLGLARALGRPDQAGAPDGGAGHLVVLRGARPLALAVDRVLGIARAAGGRGGADEEVGPEGLGQGLGNEAASGYAPAGAGGAPDFVAVDLPRLLRRALP